tara:strand:+ start:82 stop:624 length:543 start_codon:yes stop_codon:yes gene_type:complete
MSDNIRTSMGLFIPAVALVGFFYCAILGNFLGAILVAISGVMLWYIYSLIMESPMPDITGNVVVLFGSLLSAAFFLNYGLVTNMFGGFSLNIEGAAVAAILLFFSVLLGVSLRGRPVVVLDQTKSNNNPVASAAVVADSGSADDFEENDDNYDYYDPSEYEYPDYYDYDNSGYDLYEEEE